MSDYDGIKEREEGKDKMPIGMTVLFMGLIICGLVYIYLFMPQITGWTQTGRYEAEVKAFVTRSVARTGVAVAALAVAVAVTIGVGLMIQSFRSTVGNWLDLTLRADVFIGAPSAGGGRSPRSRR